MSKEPVKVIAVKPSEASLKTTDIVEKIISFIMEAGEVDVVGVGDGIFLACSAVNMATEIAKVYVNDLCIGNTESQTIGKASAISMHLGQNQLSDYGKLAEKEDKAMMELEEQTINISRAAPFERLLTVSLLRLAKYEQIRLAAAGGSINDAVALALKLATGHISKEIVGTKLVHLHSIQMRNDPTKSIAAVSIYLQKGLSQVYSKRQSDLFRKVENET